MKLEGTENSNLEVLIAASDRGWFVELADSRGNHAIAHGDEFYEDLGDRSTGKWGTLEEVASLAIERYTKLIEAGW